MQHSNQEPYKTDEFDLIKLIYLLVQRKLFIFGLTGLVTLLAIIYTYNLTPTYKATSSFTSPNDYSIAHLNKLPLTSETNNSVFSNYLKLLSSRQFQIKVFLDGDYLTVLNPENKPIANVDQFILGYINSVTITRPQITVSDLKLEFLDELPYSISMKGENAEFISSYLKDLVDIANTQTVDELKNLIQQRIDFSLEQISIERQLLLAKEKQKIDIRLEQISLERQLLLAKKKQERLNQIVVLTHAAKLAKSLGIIENNFKLISDDKTESNLAIAIGVNKDLPSWYLYGEKALLERIELLENRTSDEPFIPALVALDNEKLKLESSLIDILVPEIVELDSKALSLDSIIIDTRGISSMELNQTAFTTTITPNKRQIVLMAFIGGFIMSILLALTMDALSPYKRTLLK